MKPVFQFRWGGNLYAYSKGEYFVNGTPTGKKTFPEARDTLKKGPRAMECRLVGGGARPDCVKAWQESEKKKRKGA